MSIVLQTLKSECMERVGAMVFEFCACGADTR